MTRLTTTINSHTLREAWLEAAVQAVTPLFSAKGYVVPTCRVSVGFASTGTLRGHIGQCWSTRSSQNGINQIFISPALAEAFDVLDTLVHELVHAVDDCQHKHGKEFKKIALKVGLKGPMRGADAGPVLKAQLLDLAQTLGPYPHSALNVSVRKRPQAKRPAPSAKSVTTKSRCSKNSSPSARRSARSTRSLWSHWAIGMMFNHRRKP